MVNGFLSEHEDPSFTPRKHLPYNIGEAEAGGTMGFTGLPVKMEEELLREHVKDCPAFFQILPLYQHGIQTRWILRGPPNTQGFNQCEGLDSDFVCAFLGCTWTL